MSIFTEKELEFMASQRLGRLATVDPKGQPQNAPVGFNYNPDLDVIEIGGGGMGKSKKYRNIATNNHVSFVLDDVLPPWNVRGLEIRGIAEQVVTGGKDIFGNRGNGRDYWDDSYIRITPTQIIGWGIDTDPYHPNNRKVSKR